MKPIRKNQKINHYSVVSNRKVYKMLKTSRGFKMKIDLCVSSDEYIGHIVGKAQSKGLDAIVIVSSLYQITEYHQEYGRRNNFPILGAVKYKFLEGNVVVYGVKNDLSQEGSMREIIQRVNQMGGIAVPILPFSFNVQELSDISAVIMKSRYDSANDVDAADIQARLIKAAANLKLFSSISCCAIYLHY